MLSRNIQEKICEIFMTLAELERNVEITRQVLSENKDYNSYQIFCYLDINKKNKINDLDIFNFLRDKNIFSTENEIKLLILFYDNNLDTNLNLEEFINLIESKSSPRKDIKENNEPINFAIEYSLTKLLEKEIIYARKTFAKYGR
jgi:Ca2+-binding EF-hand superfamily protein